MDGAYNTVKTFKKSIAKKTFEQHIRFFCLVIKNRLDTLEEKHRNPALEIIEKITISIGRVPELNDSVRLPEEQFLPENFKKSIENWKNEL